MKTAVTIWNEAHAAGMAAANAHTPTPMVVVQRADMFDDNSPVVHAYAPVMGGVCGFAWVIIKPANSKFANWCKKANGLTKDGYYGGLNYWIGAFGQSYEKKCAYADAFAKVLTANGITAYAMDRMD